MNNSDMNKLTVWLVGMFPQYRPDKASSETWATELPDVGADVVIGAARRLIIRKPAPFPPSIGELLAELRGNSKVAAREVWAKILDRIRGQGQRAYPYDLNEMERQAVRLMGGIGIIANSDVGDPFTEKRFLELYDNLKEDQDVLSIQHTSSKRQLGRGQGLCETDKVGDQKRGLVKGNG